MSLLQFEVVIRTLGNVALDTDRSLTDLMSSFARDAKITSDLFPLNREKSKQCEFFLLKFRRINDVQAKKDKSKNCPKDILSMPEKFGLEHADVYDLANLAYYYYELELGSISTILVMEHYQNKCVYFQKGTFWLTELEGNYSEDVWYLCKRPAKL